MLAYYGSTSFAEYEDMDPVQTTKFLAQLVKIRDGERELQVTLAKFQMGASMGASGGEVR